MSRRFIASYYGINRTLCDVLEDIRKCDKTKNYSVLLSLVEEAQIMGDRMEAALSDLKDLKSMKDELSTHKKDLRKIEAEIKRAEEVKEAMKPN